jgi:hypothetical protein
MNAVLNTGFFSDCGVVHMTTDDQTAGTTNGGKLWWVNGLRIYDQFRAHLGTEIGG